MLTLLAIREVWTPPSASLPIHFRIRTLETKKPLNYKYNPQGVWDATVHLTYLFHHTCILSVWAPVRVAHSLMHHHILCDIFHGIYGVKKVNTSVMVACNATLALQWCTAISCVYYPPQAVIRCDQVEAALRQCQRGCCRTTTNQLACEWFIEECTQSGWNEMKHHLAETTPVPWSLYGSTLV